MASVAAPASPDDGNRKNGVNGGTNPPTEAEQYKILLQSAVQNNDPIAAQRALDLSIAATERAQYRWRESQEVELDAEGAMHAKTLNGLLKIGHLYATSSIAPERFQSNVKDNGDKSGDCAIVYQMANRLRCDFVMLLQNLYIVHGNPGVTGKFVIALLNRSSSVKGRVTFELGGEGEGRYCIASAIDAETGLKHSQRVDIALAVREGWTKPKGYGDKQQVSKWVTMPDIMLQYRAAAFLGRINFPEIILGMSTVEELEDVHGEHVVAEGSDSTSLKESTQEQVLASFQKPKTNVVEVASGLADAAFGVQSSPAAESPKVSEQPKTPKVVGSQKQEAPVAKTEAPKQEQPIKSEPPKASNGNGAGSGNGNGNGKLSGVAQNLIERIAKSGLAENIDRMVKNATSPSGGEAPLDEHELKAIYDAAAIRKEALASGK